MAKVIVLLVDGKIQFHYWEGKPVELTALKSIKERNPKILGEFTTNYYAKHEKEIQSYYKEVLDGNELSEVAEGLVQKPGLDSH